MSKILSVTELEPADFEGISLPAIFDCPGELALLFSPIFGMESDFIIEDNYSN